MFWKDQTLQWSWWMLQNFDLKQMRQFPDFWFPYIIEDSGKNDDPGEMENPDGESKDHGQGEDHGKAEVHGEPEDHGGEMEDTIIIQDHGEPEDSGGEL